MPMKSVSSPMTGGMTAPPDTPIIMRPEISFALSGRLFIAWEYITEKMLEQKKPMQPMMTIIRAVFPAKAKATIAAIATRIFILKYVTSLTLARRKEPVRAPAVRHTK